MLIYQILVPLIGLILEREVFTVLFPRTVRVQVVEVLDGDTVTVRRPRGRTAWTVRLMGMDAPEKGQPTRLGGQDAGKLSQRCLTELIRGEDWQLVWHGRDIYGRVLGELQSDRLQLSEAMLERGCASIYPLSNELSDGYRQKLLQKKQRAQRARRGLWKHGGFMRPYAWRRAQKTRRKPVAAE